ncbi:MAG: hypothetical protein AB7G44_16200 [Bacteroidia bacterium]
MKNPHASLSYHELPATELKTFADGVATGYYGNNPPFTIQPVTLAVFQALISDYEEKRSDYENGGEDQKGPFLLAKAALINALDQLAAETDKVAINNKDTIILAGFTPTKTPGETVKPGQGTVTVKRGIAGELISTCSIVEGAKHYGCIMTEGAPLPNWVTISADGRIVLETNNPMPDPMPGLTPVSVQLDFTDQREKHFLGLKHDVTYYFYFYAVNAKGVGPLSEAVSMVCW